MNARIIIHILIGFVLSNLYPKLIEEKFKDWKVRIPIIIILISGLVSLQVIRTIFLVIWFAITINFGRSFIKEEFKRNKVVFQFLLLLLSFH